MVDYFSSKIKKKQLNRNINEQISVRKFVLRVCEENRKRIVKLFWEIEAGAFCCILHPLEMGI